MVAIVVIVIVIWMTDEVLVGAGLPGRRFVARRAHSVVEDELAASEDGGGGFLSAVS